MVSPVEDPPEVLPELSEPSSSQEGEDAPVYDQEEDGCSNDSFQDPDWNPPVEDTAEPSSDETYHRMSGR